MKSVFILEGGSPAREHRRYIQGGPMKISDLRGKPVVSMSDGERVGSIRDVLVDTGRLQATALVVGGGPGQGILPLGLVKNYGPDAVTIESAEGIQWVTGQLQNQTGREASELLKLRVMDGSGTVTGEVHEITLDLPSGNILTVSVRQGGFFGIGAESVDVSVSDIVSIGASLVTVRQAMTAQASAGQG